MKCKKYFITACIPLALSLIVLAVGFVDRASTGAFNQRIFEVLDEYGTEFPLPSAEIEELDRLLSRPRPNPVSAVVIKYWGTLDDQKNYPSGRDAYEYETQLPTSTTLTIHGDDRPWYLECSNQYNDDVVFGWFSSAALVLFVLSVGLFGLWLYKVHAKNE